MNAAGTPPTENAIGHDDDTPPMGTRAPHPGDVAPPAADCKIPADAAARGPLTETLELLAQAEPIVQHFRFSHLRAELLPVSAPFAALAVGLLETVPRNAERSTALRKLLEAKDCAVRAVLQGASPIGAHR